MSHSPKPNRRHLSCTGLDVLKKDDPRNIVHCDTKSNWTLSDALGQVHSVPAPPPKISIKSFNHASREVLSLEKSKQFYVDILGFQQIPRPPFDCDGYWLYGYGLNLHLVATSTPKDRNDVKVRRIQHFSYALPRVDHIAFLTEDIASVKAVLDFYDVYYKHEVPPNTGIEQVFLFDPDGNVIEISNCAPDVGQTTCLKKFESDAALSQFSSVNHVLNSQNVASDSIAASNAAMEDEGYTMGVNTLLDEDCSPTVFRRNSGRAMSVVSTCSNHSSSVISHSSLDGSESDAGDDCSVSPNPANCGH